MSIRFLTMKGIFGNKSGAKSCAALSGLFSTPIISRGLRPGLCRSALSALFSTRNLQPLFCNVQRPTSNVQRPTFNGFSTRNGFFIRICFCGAS
jgi:hypothetical protein